MSFTVLNVILIGDGSNDNLVKRILRYILEKYPESLGILSRVLIYSTFLRRRVFENIATNLSNVLGSPCQILFWTIPS